MALRQIKAVVGIAALLSLPGCVTGPRPANAIGAAWMPQQNVVSATSACAARSSALPDLPRTTLAAATGIPLAPGDRLRIKLIGDVDRITGVYVIGDDGALALPGLPAIPAAGATPDALENRLAALLTAQGVVAPGLRTPLDLRLIESAGVSVAVDGAVFDPGMVRAGERSAETRVGQKEGATSGDSNASRTLATALRAAGGVRPDADLASVGVIRDGRLAMFDLRAALRGQMGGDVMLTGGDRVIVPSTGCFDAGLVRPTLFTTPGIRVYMSNLSRPAASNASSAIGKETTSLPYGTRLLQGLVAMNCVGGSVMNAGRRAVLISRNPMTGASVVIERRVEHLVRDAGRDAADPYLMPGDALACYDSRLMNVVDAISLVSSTASAITPAVLLRNTVTK